MRRLVLAWIQSCEKRADVARQNSMTAWTGLDMDDWDQVEVRWRRQADFWRKLV